MDLGWAMDAAVAAGFQPVGARRPSGGEHGAWFVDTAAGNRVVVKSAPDRGAPWALDGVRVFGALAASGVPAPRLHHAAKGAGRLVTVWEHLPGTPAQKLGPAALEAVFRLQAEQEGLAERCGVRRPSGWRESVLDDLGGAGRFARQHAALAACGPAGAALAAAIRSRAQRARLPGARDGDLVHGDLHHGNLLLDAGGRLTGVIDWEEWAPGDCRADLVTLLFSARTVCDDAVAGDALLTLLRERLEAETRWCYAARDVVRTLGWFAWRRPEQDLGPLLGRSSAMLDEIA